MQLCSDKETGCSPCLLSKAPFHFLTCAVNAADERVTHEEKEIIIHTMCKCFFVVGASVVSG